MVVYYVDGFRCENIGRILARIIVRNLCVVAQIETPSVIFQLRVIEIILVSAVVAKVRIEAPESCLVQGNDWVRTVVF